MQVFSYQATAFVLLEVRKVFNYYNITISYQNLQLKMAPPCPLSKADVVDNLLSAIRGATACVINILPS
ncbi:hypothetical protein NQ318_016675 [Aromia moschata]|uniref:Uncharacterized protein n=1 Tax=Aromia moschata TaxID=1265417 RepID=A0AAV8Y3L3_9CUCU|nr:hypothetical protein NQ318_016675 [Aromia moschata]